MFKKEKNKKGKREKERKRKENLWVGERGYVWCGAVFELLSQCAEVCRIILMVFLDEVLGVG